MGANNYTWGTAMNQIVFPVGVKNNTAAIFLLFFLDAFYSFAKIKQMIHVDLNEGTTFLSEHADCLFMYWSVEQKT
jgi:hypothetical protein